MPANIPSFVAGILIVFSVLLGSQAQDNKSAPTQGDFLSSKNESKADANKNTSSQGNTLRNEFAGLLELLNVSQRLDTTAVPPARLFLAKDIPAPELGIKAGIAISESGKIFYEKNPHQKLPIASITKLITAQVVFDELNPDEVITISESAVNTYGEAGNLVKGEQLTTSNLLYIMLIGSSNDAAVALSETIEANGKNFIGLMNKKAEELQLFDSSFSDPSGLDPRNISSAYDLAILMNQSLMNPRLAKILNTEEVDIFSSDKKIAHRLENTNKLLDGDGVIAGKTGYTEEAGECLVLAVKLNGENKYFISVVLGTGIGMRFIEMERLANWTKKVQGWQ